MLATDSKTDKKMGSRGEYGHGMKMSPYGKLSDTPNAYDKRDFNKRSRRAAKLALKAS